MAANMIPIATTIATIITAALLLIWIIVPINKTVIPYSLITKDEATLISRIMIRVMLLLFFIRSSLISILEPCMECSAWVNESSIVLSAMTIAMIIITIKIHPDGPRGL